MKRSFADRQHPKGHVLIAHRGTITVAFMDPEAVLQLVERPGISDFAKQVRARLDRVREAIAAEG
jgi:hypothetical protein